MADQVAKTGKAVHSVPKKSKRSAAALGITAHPAEKGLTRKDANKRHENGKSAMLLKRENDPMSGVTQPRLRTLTHLYGIEHLSRCGGDAMRAVAKHNITELLRMALAHCQHRRCKTVSTKDVKAASAVMRDNHNRVVLAKPDSKKRLRRVVVKKAVAAAADTAAVAVAGSATHTEH